MSKLSKIIISGIISLILTYVAYSIFVAIVYHHSTEWNNRERYLWLFNDSVKADLDPRYAVGDVRDSDILYYYLYKRNYYIKVWEFKKVSIKQLDDIPINQNVLMNRYKLTSGEELHGIPEIYVKFKIPFHDFISINLNEKSKILQNFQGENYRGFFGDINKMSLQNREGENLIMFDYKDKIEPTLFLLYQKSERFFVLVVNSKNPFDESIIGIFNLSK